jgi:hypothetical protein
MSRGEMDLDLGEEAGELKSINSRALRTMPDVPPDDPALRSWLIEHKAPYYAQAQEYLRMAKRPAMRFLFLQTEYPFNKREILLPYDAGAALKVRDKYARVRQAVADQRPPEGACAPGATGARQCPARGVCGCVGARS